MLNSIEEGNCLLLTFAFPQQGIYVFFRINRCISSEPSGLYIIPISKSFLRSPWKDNSESSSQKFLDVSSHPSLRCLSPLPSLRELGEHQPPPYGQPFVRVLHKFCPKVPPDAHGNVEQEVTQKKVVFLWPFRDIHVEII